MRPGCCEKEVLRPLSLQTFLSCRDATLGAEAAQVLQPHGLAALCSMWPSEHAHPTYWHDRDLQSRAGFNCRQRSEFTLFVAFTTDELDLMNLPAPAPDLCTSRAIHHTEVMRDENLLGKSMGKVARWIVQHK